MGGQRPGSDRGRQQQVEGGVGGGRGPFHWRLALTHISAELMDPPIDQVLASKSPRSSGCQCRGCVL
eukprot:1824035-Rhodomonas_salina.1